METIVSRHIEEIYLKTFQLFTHQIVTVVIRYTLHSDIDVRQRMRDRKCFVTDKKRRGCRTIQYNITTRKLIDASVKFGRKM
jgi:NADPH-dependent 7-cyano-7-deazaguanine reductase QueF